MKKFIIKTAIFVLPFLLLYISYLSLGTIRKGDLLRVGFLIDHTENYREQFKTAVNQPIKYSTISDLATQPKRSFDILTIGDSFSEQKGFGYQNYLAQCGTDVLHFNQSGNALQTLYGIVNGDILDTIDVDYILVESVERRCVQRSYGLNKDKVITYANALSDIPPETEEQSQIQLFSGGVIKFLLYNLLYNQKENAYFSKVYKTKTTHPLFSTGKNELLFLSQDIDLLRHNNHSENVSHFNNELNALAHRVTQKGITLIFMPSPDKFDLYYDYIATKENYPRPLFFETLRQLPKSYTFIDTKELIQAEIPQKRDLYFYDDAHWTPATSEMLAHAIYQRFSQRSSESVQP